MSATTSPSARALSSLMLAPAGLRPGWPRSCGHLAWAGKSREPGDLLLSRWQWAESPREPRPMQDPRPLRLCPCAPCGQHPPLPESLTSDSALRLWEPEAGVGADYLSARVVSVLLSQEALRAGPLLLSPAPGLPRQIPQLILALRSPSEDGRGSSLTGEWSGLRGVLGPDIGPGRPWTPGHSQAAHALPGLGAGHGRPGLPAALASLLGQRVHTRPRQTRVSCPAAAGRSSSGKRLGLPNARVASDGLKMRARLSAPRSRELGACRWGT